MLFDLNRYHNKIAPLRFAIIAHTAKKFKIICVVETSLKSQHKKDNGKIKILIIDDSMTFDVTIVIINYYKQRNNLKFAESKGFTVAEILLTCKLLKKPTD